MGLGLFLVGKMALAMATSSLSTDEFGTVGSFSSKGPGHVMTDYRAPKNHVFFNLLNSLLPGRESLAPARVRALSILATALAALVLVFYGAWRERWMESAIVLALWSTAPQSLSLAMEARGYGFLDLFAVLATVATFEYAASRHRLWLWILSGSITLGVYTIPGFLFFGAPLLLLLWLTERTRGAFAAGAFTAVAILALYAPLVTQVVAEFTGFHQDKAEADFASVHALVRAVKLYFFASDDWESWSILLLLALAPFAAPPIRPRESSALRIVTISCLVYLGILLALKTPPVHVAAFTMLPLALAGLWAIGGWLRKPAFLRAGACALLALALGGQLAFAIATFRFTPSEDWALAGRAVDAAFPDSTHVEFKRFAKYLQKTLPRAGQRSADYNDMQFSCGYLVVADAGNKWAEGDRFTPPKGLDRVVQWVIPGTIRDIDLTLRVLPTNGRPTAPPALADGSANTGIDVPPEGYTFDCGEPAAGEKALIVLFNRTVTPDELRITASGTQPLVAGNALVAPFRQGAPLRLQIAAGGARLQIVEAWITR